MFLKRNLSKIGLGCLCLIGGLLAPTVVEANSRLSQGLDICNYTNKDLNVAVAYRSLTGSTAQRRILGWNWVPVSNAGCSTLITGSMSEAPFGGINGYYYIAVQSNDHSILNFGSENLCVPNRYNSRRRSPLARQCDEDEVAVSFCKVNAEPTQIINEFVWSSRIVIGRNNNNIYESGSDCRFQGI